MAVGRVLYLRGYSAAAEKRELGFTVQAIACAVLLVGDVVAIVGRVIRG